MLNPEITVDGFGSIPVSRWKHPIHDGWHAVKYDFGLNDKAADRLGQTLNEACHVFHQHADGQWQSLYKDRYASELAIQVQHHPELRSRILRCGDRVVRMITYRAMELVRA